MIEETNLKYYCYACEKQFIVSFEAYSCPVCDSCVIELIQQEQTMNQSKFEVFELKPSQTSIQTLGMLENVVCPWGHQGGRTLVSIVSTTITHDLSSLPQGSYLGNLLRQLLREGNGMTAATQQQIARLQKIQRVKECSICQSVEEQGKLEEEYEKCQGFKLSCNHTFHVQCIKPWLEKTNTCPVCRKGLL